MKFKLTSLLFFLFHVIASWAQPMLRMDNSSKELIGHYTMVLEDPAGKLKIEDVIKRSQEFKKVKENVFNSTPSSSAFWIKFSLLNNSNKPLFLEIDNPTINELDIYSVKASSITTLTHSGDQLPFSQRAVKRSNYIIRLDLERGEEKSYYIRYTSSEIMGLPLTIGTAEFIIEKSNIKDLMAGIFYGVLLVTLLYNFFLYLSIRDITYLNYVAYMAFFTLMQSSLLGHLHQFLFITPPFFNNHITFIASGLTGIFCINFIRNFLQTKNRVPACYKIGVAIQVLFIIGVLINLFNSQIGELILSFSGLLLALYMLLAGILVYAQGYSPARYYILATLSSLLSVVIYILKGLKVLPYTQFTNNIMEIGVAAEAILFSFALGDRYKTIEKENEKIQLELNKELRLKIEERTRAQNELTQSNKRLKTINKDLDNFVYTASHDLRAPISNLEGLLIMLKDSKDENEKTSVIQYMSDSVEKFKDTIMELTEISKIQRDDSSDIKEIEFEAILKDTKSLFKQFIAKESISIRTDFSKSSSIHYSNKNLKSIIYNLLSNAIKYRSSDRPTIINITTQKSEEFIILTFQDNGIGIPEEQFDVIFKMFKRYHTHVEGTGVGLYIIKRIVENAGGKIDIQSTVGEGSKFKIYLKDQRI